MPETLQQARSAAHFTTAIGRQQLTLSTLNALVKLDAYGQPELGHTVTDGNIARAQAAASTLPVKCTTKLVVKAETAELCGSRRHLTSMLLKVVGDSPEWLDLQPEIHGQIKRETDLRTYYRGIRRKGQSLFAVIGYERAGYEGSTYFVNKNRSEILLRRELWKVEDHNLGRAKLDLLDQSMMPQLELPYAYQNALLVFEKLKDDRTKPYLTTEPIRRSVIGRAVDWAYENLP